MHDHHRHAGMNVLHPEQVAACRIGMSEKLLLRSLDPLQTPKTEEMKQADHRLQHRELIA